MTSETKKQRHKKSHPTRKRVEIVHQKVIPPFPLVPPVQNSRKPGHDFYMYVNGEWLRHAKPPSYRAAFGVSEELEEMIKENLSVLLDKSIDFAKKDRSVKSSLESSFKLLGQFGLSALRPSVQKKSIHLLKRMINDINCIRDTNEICKVIGLFIRYRITSLLSLYTYFEPGSKIYGRIAIAPGELGLPDISYYLPNDEQKASALSEYGKMLDKVGNLLDLDLKLSSVIPIEQGFARELYKYQTQKEQVMEGKTVAKKYPGINWADLFEVVGYKDWTHHTIRLNPPGWFETISDSLSTLTIDEWKLLLSTHLILHALPLLPPPFDDIHSGLFEKKLRGQSRKLPQKELTIRLLQDWMPTTTSKLYQKYFVDPSLKRNATEFVKTIQAAAVDRIRNTTWFADQTREKAVQKVKKMKLGVAYPEKLKPLTGIHLQTDNLLQNILTLGETHTKDEIKKANHVNDIQNEWEEAVYAVNAYYYSEVNQLILPAGSILWPFYHPNAPFGWNYGGLGAVIGHEMTHAFDSDGKDYNWEGKKEKWWTAHDNREYNKRTKALVDLFNSAKVLNHPVSGSLTLNENISDLGGLAIALDALHLECKKQRKSQEEKKEALRNFFISYAVSWRIKEKPEKVIQGLFMDRHAPAPLRVNLIVSQFDEWYDAFSIQVNDPLYIPPQERIRIF